MATVINKGNTAMGVDRPYCSPNRVNAGTPIGAVTPLYGGEIVHDITNGGMYVAMPRPGIALANTDWTLISPVLV